MSVMRTLSVHSDASEWADMGRQCNCETCTGSSGEGDSPIEASAMPFRRVTADEKTIDTALCQLYEEYDRCAVFLAFLSPTPDANQNTMGFKEHQQQPAGIEGEALRARQQALRWCLTCLQVPEHHDNLSNGLNSKVRHHVCQGFIALEYLCLVEKDPMCLNELKRQIQSARLDLEAEPGLQKLQLNAEQKSHDGRAVDGAASSQWVSGGGNASEEANQSHGADTIAPDQADGSNEHGTLKTASTTSGLEQGKEILRRVEHVEGLLRHVLSQTNNQSDAIRSDENPHSNKQEESGHNGVTSFTNTDQKGIQSTNADKTDDLPVQDQKAACPSQEPSSGDWSEEVQPSNDNGVGCDGLRNKETYNHDGKAPHENGNEKNEIGSRQPRPGGESQLNAVGNSEEANSNNAQLDWTSTETSEATDDMRVLQKLKQLLVEMKQKAREGHKNDSAYDMSRDAESFNKG